MAMKTKDQIKRCNCFSSGHVAVACALRSELTLAQIMCDQAVINWITVFESATGTSTTLTLYAQNHPSLENHEISQNIL